MRKKVEWTVRILWLLLSVPIFAALMAGIPAILGVMTRSAVEASLR